MGSETLKFLDDTYDLLVIGSSFASSFFLSRYLQRARPSARILVLERGDLLDHRSHITREEELTQAAANSFNGERSSKPWPFRLAVGGSSNCWWACTPRFLPEDFRLHSTYGVGRDWPVSYDDLEEYYCDAEETMSVAGPQDDSPFERSRPYPLPPHRYSEPDRLFKQRFPDTFFAHPTARPSRRLSSGRPRCCATGVCSRCPIDSKFTVLNSLMHLYQSEPRVRLVTGATVTHLEVANNRVVGVGFSLGGVERRARADLVALGANSVFNPFILLRSGLTDGMAGQGLAEQVSRTVLVDLSGVDGFQGSTSITGHGYMLYSGPHRRERAAALIESWNVPFQGDVPLLGDVMLLRNEKRKWRQRLKLKVIFEDLPQPENRVTIGADQSRPDVEYGVHSSYAQRGIDHLDADLPRVLEALPVEGYQVLDAEGPTTQGHNLGTTRMGTDPATSVVDRQLMHHRVRNLVVLGGSVFPTITPANPTLTISALSLWAASRLAASGAGSRSASSTGARS